MKMSLGSRASLEPPGVLGPARVDQRIGAAIRRASAGDVVVVDLVDLDRRQAEALLERGVAAVVDASALISGRYPNLGPQLLARAGVVLVDGVGSAVFGALREGTRVRVHDGRVIAGDRVVASGRQLGLQDVERLMAEAREGLGHQLQAFTHNTTEFLRREEQLLLHGVGLPALQVAASGRPAVVVVRDFDHEADLRQLRRFIRERNPVLFGVDGGADALVAAGLVPDVVVTGEGGSQDGGVALGVSDTALTRAGQVVLHSTEPGGSVRAARLDRLRVRAQQVLTGGTAEDVALLLADNLEASVIVTIGAHATLEEFLDRQRTGLPSTFLTRLRVGPRLVDAKALPVLYAGGPRTWQLVIVLLAGLLALTTALLLTPQGAVMAEQLAEVARGLVTRVGTRAGEVLP